MKKEKPSGKETPDIETFQKKQLENKFMLPHIARILEQSERVNRLIEEKGHKAIALEKS
jgi:hypothetical protein